MKRFHKWKSLEFAARLLKELCSEIFPLKSVAPCSTVDILQGQTCQFYSSFRPQKSAYLEDISFKFPKVLTIATTIADDLSRELTNSQTNSVW